MIARGGRGRPAGAALLVLLLTSPALAQDEFEEGSEFAQKGVYAGVAAGVAIEAAQASRVEDSWALNGWVGYRVLPLVAIEAQVEHTSADDLKFGSGGLESITWTVNGRLYFGTARVQPYALFGLGMGFGMESGDRVGNNADLALRAGLGVETHVTGGLSVVLAGHYVGGFHSNRQLDYGSATVGVQYQF